MAEEATDKETKEDPVKDDEEDDDDDEEDPNAEGGEGGAAKKKKKKRKKKKKKKGGASGGQAPLQIKEPSLKPPALGLKDTAFTDYYVKYGLSSASGVSEVASIGGYVQEYQIDIDPELMRQYNIGLHHIVKAVKQSNKDIGAQTLEINQAEYLVRGLGFVERLEDLEATVVAVRQNTPIRIRDVARTSLGPSLRRGLLDDEGAPAVGGIVVSRYQQNPLSVIKEVKEKIAQIQPGLPQRTLEDGTISKVKMSDQRSGPR